MIQTVAPGHFCLHGHLDMQESSDLLAELLQAVDQLDPAVATLTLDVGKLESADSLLLATILGVLRRLQGRGTRLQLEGLGAGMRGLARMYGIDGLLEPCCKD